MSNAPITVSGRALPEAVIKNIVRGPIVKPVVESSLISNDILGSSLGFNQSVYKVKLVANGRTFNMLLPPSIESKHPGRSNPLQLPGLQIESTSNISKLKIPGFFPIYQHLGVESLYISMSGMFTGYDGEDQISAAGDWEGWANPEVKGGQDAYTAACDLFDFAVKNKALTTVTISTSDGSFEPKKSASTNFRDEQSNIRFKGYIKELKQIYIRQDRVYYMLKFEIIDLGNSKKECTSKNAPSNTEAAKRKRGTSDPNVTPITDLDRKYRPKDELQLANKTKALIDKGASIQEIRKEVDKITSTALATSLLLYAEEKGYSVDTDLTKILNDIKSNNNQLRQITTEKEKVVKALYYNNALFLCQRFNDSCNDVKKASEAQRLENARFENGQQSNTTNNSFNSPDTSPSQPITNPTNINQQKQKAATLFTSPLQKEFANDLALTLNDERSFTLADKKYYDSTSNLDINKDALKYIGNNSKGFPLFKSVENTDLNLSIPKEGTFVAIPNKSTGRISIELEK